MCQAGHRISGCGPAGGLLSHCATNGCKASQPAPHHVMPLVCGGSPGGLALLRVRCVSAVPAAERGEALHAVGTTARAAGGHGALLVGAGDGPPPAAAAAATVCDGGGASGGGADRQGGQDKARCLHAAPREGGAGAGGVGVPGLARPFPPSVSTAALEHN